MDTEVSAVSKQDQSGQLRRKELVMLLEQALANLGFGEVAQQLAAESQIPFETPGVSSLRRAILGGRYEEALRLVDRLGLVHEGHLKRSKFLILEQKFLEVHYSPLFRSAVALILQFREIRATSRRYRPCRTEQRSLELWP